MQASPFFKIYPNLPQCSTHESPDLGKDMDAERKESFSMGRRPAFPKNDKGEKIMSSKNNNQINVPQAREAMDKFKMQAASEVGVNLTNGYNGHLTSREAGSVGGQMVKKMIEAYEQGLQ